MYLKGGFCTHGETYYRDDEVLWWAKGGELHGESAKRIAFLKEIIYGLGEIQPIPSNFANNPNDLEKANNPEVISNPFELAFTKLDPVHFELIRFQEDKYAARHEDLYFIQYMGKSCQSVLNMELPEEAEYSIDLVDIWEMTRRNIIPLASGKTKVPLPGEEGTAVIATRI
ncbi:DUF5605 domain-containing protein [Paenibacillus albidus]|uniref:DUF5605 domain-containing protein n=1 Tax=Paenibacillus albidus TaxID=2041023 RepID=UPI001BE62044|nr:DUF5605 domain-containing protein [Paenibacillus albidus]MBT2291519.1 DUF5605 domain-containing protein [Paenibacillus albidus]